MGPFASFD